MQVQQKSKSKFHTIVYGLTRSHGIKNPHGVRFEVEKMSKSFRGGSKNASIKAYGPSNNLFDLIHCIFNHIEVIDQSGNPVWFGKITEVHIYLGDYLVGINLEEVFNAIKIIYTTSNSPAGVEYQETEWREDALSIERYGRRELVYSVGESNFNRAVETQIKMLYELKDPHHTILTIDEGEDTYAEIFCEGYYSLLQFQYYTNSVPSFEMTEMGRREMKIGGQRTIENDIDFNWILGQSFKYNIPEPVFLKEVFFHVRRTPNNDEYYEGRISPTDNLVLRLYEGSDTLPVLEMATSTVGWSEVPFINGGWVKFLFEGISLTPNQTYWLILDRSNQGTGTGTNGTFTLSYYNGTVNDVTTFQYGRLGWSETRSPYSDWETHTDRSLMFRIITEWKVDRVIKDILDKSGSFLGSYKITHPSPFFENPNKDGSTTCLTELERMLDTGIGDFVGEGHRRYMVEIDYYLNVIITPEPEKPFPENVQYYISRKGVLKNRSGLEIDANKIPVGFWAMYEDLPQGVIGFETTQKLSVVFVEECVYDNVSGRFIPVLKNTSHFTELRQSLETVLRNR